MQTGIIKRFGAIGCVIAMALTLTACLLSPGKFVSSLDVRKDGQFTFTYKGEVFMLALTKLAEMGKNSDSRPFEAMPCFDQNDNDRACTEAEIATQKKDWQDEQQASAERSKKQAEEMKPLLGGMDPSDPKQAEEFAAKLSRQAGWRSVVYKGEGLYEVDFAISGKLDHDFTFPTIEGFPMANAFVQLSLRNDGTLRVETPGFAPSAGGSPYMQLMQMGMAEEMAKADKDGKKNMPKIPVLSGQFTVTTNGHILANNTDEGPKQGTTGQMMTWKIGLDTKAPPTALIKLGN